MILTHEFDVQAPVADTWPVVTDIPRVARCLPGAELESSEGALHRGRLSAKVGPISATYAGTATVLESDDDTHTVVLQLEAREARGQGMARAVLTIRLTDVSDGTHIAVETDLQMTGAHAQFGRGILQSVAGKMIDTFAANLGAEIAADTEETLAPSKEAGEPTVPSEAKAVATTSSSDGSTAFDFASMLPVPSPLELVRASGLLLAGVAFGTLWRSRHFGRGAATRSDTGGTTVHIHLGPAGGDA